jgi:HEAT repeat protein
MFGSRERQRTRVADVVQRAHGYAADDYGRWEVLEELDVLGHKVVFSEAMRLCRSASPEEITLGAQMLDGLLTRDLGNRQKAEAGLLLIDICRPTQDPAVLAAALHPYAMIWGFAELYVDLTDHADPCVRRSAAQLLGSAEEEDDRARAMNVLIALLDGDPDDRVRAEAADALAYGLECDDEQQQTVRAAFTPYLDSPTPEIRAAALFHLASVGDRRGFTELCTGLASPSAPWSMVQAGGLLAISDELPADLRADFHQRLADLRHNGWAEHDTPGVFPRSHHRAAFLRKVAEVIEAAGG